MMTASMAWVTRAGVSDGGQAVVYVKCPYCAREHQHGWAGSTGGDDGRRASHCNNGEYIITERRKRDRRDEPSVHALYRFHDAAGNLLYVGLTCNPGHRFKRHRTEKEWWAEVANITIQNFATREELQAAEREAIQSERPRYNVVHNGGKQTLNTQSLVAARSGAGLAGSYFHTTRQCGRHGAQVAVWQGRIVDQVAEGILLIQLYEWVMGEPNGRELISLPDFMSKNPVLYETAEDMRFSYDYGRLAHSHRCIEQEEIA